MKIRRSSTRNKNAQFFSDTVYMFVSKRIVENPVLDANYAMDISNEDLMIS